MGPGGFQLGTLGVGERLDSAGFEIFSLLDSSFLLLLGLQNINVIIIIMIILMVLWFGEYQALTMAGCINQMSRSGSSLEHICS